MKDSAVNRADFLDDLLLNNRITLKDLNDCMRAKRLEITEMENIFDLKTEEDARRCAALPRLLFPQEADAITAYFRQEEEDNPVMKIPEPSVEEYKVLLAASFVYNRAFFAMAWNWCAAIREELRKSGFELIVFGKRRLSSHTMPFFESRAAASIEPVFRSFGEHPLEGYGNLVALCCSTEKARYVKLQFRPEKPLPQELKKPYRMAILFICRADNTEHLFHLPGREDRHIPHSGETLISKSEEIDYASGIDIKQIQIFPWNNRRD